MKIALDLNSFSIGRAYKEIFKDDCIYWTNEQKPIYDLLDEFKPDVMVVDVRAISPIFIEAVNEYKTRLVIYGAGVPDGLNPDIVCAKASTSDFIRRHIEESAKQVLYQKDHAHCCFEVKKDLFSRRKVGHICFDNNPEAIYRKLVGMGEITASKSIVGQKLMVEYYLGKIDLDEMPSYLNAHDIYLDFDGGLLLDGAAYGTYVISPIQNSLFSLFSVDNLNEKCNNILSDKKYRKEVKEAREKVWEIDTCYHRVAEVLEALDLPELKTAKKLIEEKRRCALEY